MSLGISIGIGIGPFGEGGGFSPPQLPGLVNWYRADQGITIATGVSQWNDLSGQGRHLVQATTTKQPPFSASGGPNGTPYVGSFDGTDDFLRATYAQTAPEHHFVVAMPSATDETSAADVLDGAAGNSRRLFIVAADTIGMFGGASTLPDTPVESAAFHRFNCEWVSGAGSAITVDNRTRLTGNVGTSSSGGLILGMFGDQASNPSNCRIAEIIIYSRILAAVEVAAVNAYLLLRYTL